MNGSAGLLLLPAGCRLAGRTSQQRLGLLDWDVKSLWTNAAVPRAALLQEKERFRDVEAPRAQITKGLRCSNDREVVA